MMRILEAKVWIVVIATSIAATTADAQILGGASSTDAAGRVQAQAQQRAQTQVQQRAQTQVQQRAQTQVQQRALGQAQQQVQANLQQRVQAEVQARVGGNLQSRVSERMKADTARAIGVANRLEAKVDGVANHAQINGDASIEIAGRSETRSGENGSHADANSHTGLSASASSQHQVTAADIKIYDEIFGQFNPLRAQPSQPRSGGQTQNSATPPSDHQDRRGLSSIKRPAFATLIVMAAQERRAEIATLRDRAVVSGDTAAMVRADEMEQRLDAFVQASATANAEAAATGHSSGSTQATSRTAGRASSGF